MTIGGLAELIRESGHLLLFTGAGVSTGSGIADFRGPLFRGVEVGNFELQPGFPAAEAGARLPTHVRELLKWPSDWPVFPGAYPAAR